MLVQVNINTYNTKCDTFIKEFETTCDFEQIKEDYINKLDLINTISNFNKSKIYFFTDNIVIRPNTKLEKVVEPGRKRLFVVALYDYDNNFAYTNTYIWLSNVTYGNYYLYCPQNMTIKEIINKYEQHLASINIKPNKIILTNAGRRVDETDTVGTYSQSSLYAVFTVQIY